jgi:hypothetical protein
MIEPFSSWFLVKGDDRHHFHIRFAIGMIAISLDREHRGHPC